MKRIYKFEKIDKIFLFIFVSFLSSVQGQNNDGFEPIQTSPIEFKKNYKISDNLSKIDQSVKVSILLYHDFSISKETDMKIRIDKFREQMQTIKDSRLNVISMKDFLDWKKGLRNIPNPSIIITIDDGWKEIYTLAYPILKDFKYPFTIFLYKDYIDVDGRSLSKSEIKEMMANGCEVGSHTISHTSLRKKDSMSEEDYQNFLRKEILGSKIFLEEILQTKISYFSYPYGIYTDDAIEMGKSSKYELLLTVNPGKNRWETSREKINRYIISGISDDNFKNALIFQGDNYLTENQIKPKEEKKEFVKKKFDVRLYPEHNQIISERLPTITVDLSKLDFIDLDSIEMYLDGFGKVPAKLNKETMQLSYTVNRKIRNRRQQVFIKFRFYDKTYMDTIRWSFKIDHETTYHEIIQKANIKFNK